MGEAQKEFPGFWIATGGSSAQVESSVCPQAAMHGCSSQNGTSAAVQYLAVGGEVSFIPPCLFCMESH